MSDVYERPLRIKANQQGLIFFILNFMISISYGFRL